MNYKHITVTPNGRLVTTEANGNPLRTKLSGIEDFKTMEEGDIMLFSRNGTRYVVSPEVANEIAQAQDEKKVTQ